MVFIFDLIPGVKLGLEVLWEDSVIVLDLAIIRIYIDYNPQFEE